MKTCPYCDQNVSEIKEAVVGEIQETKDIIYKKMNMTEFTCKFSYVYTDKKKFVQLQHCEVFENFLYHAYCKFVNQTNEQDFLMFLVQYRSINGGMKIEN